MNIFHSRPLHKVACLSALVLAIGLAGGVEAGSNTSIYGETYQKVESVVATQAQVVMFRGNDDGKQAAHVYIDGELQSALMPGGYTVFCTPAGEHSVESYIGDAPLYTGKRNPQSYANLAGGQTYVLEAPVGVDEKTPIVHTGKEAERSLQGMRRQIHVLSRASAVVPCQMETRLSLRSDVLFAFGKGSYYDLTAEGRSQLGQVVQEIKQEQNKVQSVEIVGHADSIGNAEANQRLSLQRAETIRRVLLEAGIQSDQLKASGRGSLDPVVQCNSGSRSAQIACNAPNRRVELVIHGAQASM